MPGLRPGTASWRLCRHTVQELRDELAELRERYERVQQQLIDGQQEILTQGRETRAAIDGLAGQMQITTERIRAHLLTAVEDAYRRDLQAAETAADWQAREQQRQAAARQRNRDDLQPLLTSAGLYAAKGEAGSARALYQEVLELEPEWPAALDGNLWFLIAQGDLAVVRGRLADAGRDFAQARALAERLAGLEPDNRDWQHNLGLCLSRIGDTKAAQGDLAGALADYGQSLAIAERLAAADPSNAGWQRDLYVSHWRLADLNERRGEPQAAQAHWRQAYAVLRD